MFQVHDSPLLFLSLTQLAGLRAMDLSGLRLGTPPATQPLLLPQPPGGGQLQQQPACPPSSISSSPAPGAGAAVAGGLVSLQELHLPAGLSVTQNLLEVGRLLQK